ncbi:hypothetical protein GCM10022199_13730 [Marihabitans asiaticum]|uniref:HD domain-containing phosphohydrolase n=1 Tax=Marihabitans asiaticum TaxID=415218 RepID=UPI0031D1FE55
MGRLLAGPRSYLAALALGGATAAGATVWVWGPPRSLEALVTLLVLSLLARLTPPSTIGHVTISLHSIVLIAAIPIASPSGAVIIHSIPTLLRYRSEPDRLVFNLAGPLIGIFIGSGLYSLVSPTPLQRSDPPTIGLGVVAIALATGVWNALSLASILRRTEGTPGPRVLRLLAPQIALAYLGYASAAYLLVLLWAVVGLGWFSVVLVLPSLALAQWALLQYHREDEAYEVLLTGLVEAMDERLPGSRERSRLCADTARVIAETLRVEPRQAQTIVSVARLHDVGLLAVDHEAPGCRVDGRCTADPQAATSLRRHVDASAELLSGVTFLSDALPGIRAHHERYDGTGYPDGLSGSAIPLAARVVAVADAWASLVHPLDGSTPLTPEDAVLRCREWSGSALDPACVAALEAGLTRQPGAFTAGVRGLSSSDPVGSASLVDHAHPDCTQTLAHLTMPGARA